MKITVDTKELARALKAFGKVIQARAAMPIAKCIKIEAAGNHVTLTGTDLMTYVSVKVGANIEADGAGCVQYDILSRFISSAKSETAIIEIDGEEATARAGKSRIKLFAFDVGDFPNDTRPAGDLVEVDAETLATAIRFCAPGASTDEVKYYLKGLYFTGVDGDAVVYATNGHVLHKAIIAGAGTMCGSAILPLEVCQTVAQIVSGSGTAKVFVGPDGWTIEAGEVAAHGRVIDGTYPDIQRVEASAGSPSRIASAPKEAFTNAISVATCGADTNAEKSHAIVIKAVDGQPLQMWGAKAGTGAVRAGRTEVATECKGDYLGGVSSRYVVNALSGVDGDASIGCAGDMVFISPAQDSATLALSAMVMIIRVDTSDPDA